MLSTIRMPAAFSCGTASGAGVSIRSTCPANSALVRVNASGSGTRISLSVFGMRGAGNQEPQHLIGEERVDGLGRDLNGGVVDLGVARNRRQAGLDLRA